MYCGSTLFSLHLKSTLYGPKPDTKRITPRYVRKHSKSLSTCEFRQIGNDCYVQPNNINILYQLFLIQIIEYGHYNKN